MKDCPDCITYQIQQSVLQMTFAAWEGKIAECRRLGHLPFRKIKPEEKDICVQCLATSYATVKVLSDQLSSPVDQSGRPLRFSTDSAMKSGVWALKILPRRFSPWPLTVFWAAFVVLLGCAFALSCYLFLTGPHL